MWPFDLLKKTLAPDMEAKASRAASLTVMTPGQPEWSGRDYEAFAREAYTINVIGSRCVAMVADAVASVKLEVWQGGQEVTSGKLYTLLQRPNPSQGYREYMVDRISYALISGNSYEEAVLSGVTFGEPLELWNLRPDKMKVIKGSDGEVSAYLYSQNGRDHRFEVDGFQDGVQQINHTKFFNPINDTYGMSPVEPAARAVDQHNEAMTWMQSLLQNAARPSGAIVSTTDDVMSDDEYQRIKAQLEDNYQGARNAGRPMLLEGGLDWKPMALSPHDMQIMEVKASAARDICFSFGVPPMLLGIPGDNTFANYKEARQAFWEDTVMPLTAQTFQAMQRWLAQAGEELKPNYDAIPAVVEKRQMLWEQADRSTDLTIDERRALKGYEPLPNGEGNRLASPAQQDAQPVAQKADPISRADAMIKAHEAAYGPVN